MKKKHSFRVAMILPLVIAGGLFYSCDKKSPSNPGAATSQRITEEANFINDTLYSKTVYQYTGNLLSSVVSYNDQLVKTGKILFQYNGEQLTSITGYDTTGGNWYKYMKTEITTFSGSNPAEILSHSYDQAGTEYDHFKWVYSFGTAGLTSAIRYNYSSGAWMEYEKYLYQYDNNNRVMRANITYNGNFEYGLTYIYQGSILTTQVDSSYYAGVWNVWKYALEYTGGLFTTGKGYAWSNNSWSLYYTENYTYNDFGNIVTYQSQDVNVPGITREEYKYESGIGNYRQYEVITGNFRHLVNGWPWPSPFTMSGTGPVWGRLRDKKITGTTAPLFHRELE